MRKQNVFIEKGIASIESTKLFVYILYAFLLAHNFYDYFFLKNTFLIRLTILEIIFLLLFFICCLLNKYLIKRQKEHYLKYLFLLLWVIYMIGHDTVIIDNAENYIISPYIEIFIIIFSPLFLSSVFFITLSISVLFRYFILIHYFQSVHLSELIFTVIIAILVSFFILLNLKFLVKKIELEHKTQMKETMLLIMKIIELKDPYTKGHSERVAKYAKTLAEETQLYDEKELENFYFACLLHDIGKIGIPDEILNKNSRLTEEEYTIIKNHSCFGSRLLGNIPFISENECIIRSHHEKWDGSGYPDGLKEEEIPLNARIVSIADAFDAMTSTRSYRYALPPQEAYKRIIEGAGTQFDPNLIKLFKKVYPVWIGNFKNTENRR